MPLLLKLLVFMITVYISIGIGVWLGLAVARRSTFKGASKGEIARGIAFGILAWPIGLFIVYRDTK